MKLPFSALSAACLALAACGPSSPPSAASTSGRPVVALVMKSLANEFFQNMAEGARRHQAAHDGEYELVVNGIKNETDLAEQAGLVEQMVAQGAQAIVIAPADSMALVTVLKRARAAGVLVINIDNRLDAEALAQAGLTIPFVGPDNRDGARRVGEVVTRQLRAGDEAAIIEGVATAFNSQQRRAGFEDALNAAGIKIVAVQGGDWEMEKASTVAAGLLTAHPSLRAILCANDSMALGAAAAVQGAQKTGQVLVAGFDNISAVKPLLADGRLSATADQHGADLAVFGIEAALRALSSGSSTPADQQTPVDVVTR